MRRFCISLFIFIIAVCAVYPQNARVLVTTFVNNSQQEYTWLGYGIEASVIADISKIAGIDAISMKDRKKALDELAYQMSGMVEEEKVLRAGKTLGANLILSGEYTVMGQDVRLTARLSLVEQAAIISTVKLDGNINGIFDMQDEVVIRLLAGIDEKKSGGIKAMKLSGSDIQAIKNRDTDFSNFEYNAKALELMGQVPQEFLDIEQAIFKYINEERSKAGVKHLLYNQRLAALARYHSMNMQVYNFFSLTDQNGMDSTGRKMMLAPELFGHVDQYIAANYGGSADEVAKNIVKQMMEPDSRDQVLKQEYNYVGIGIFRGDGENFRYFCTVVPALLMMEMVSNPPKRVSYGSEVTLKFKFIGTFPKEETGVFVRFPDPNARLFIKGTSSYYTGTGRYTPQNWDGEFFTITIKCDKGRGAYVILPAQGERYIQVGLTYIAQ